MAEPVKKEIQVIKNDSIISMKMSGYFYSRMQQVIKVLLDGKSEVEIQSAFKEIETKKITQEWIQSLETMFIFCKDFENTAKVEKLVVKQDVEKV
jgi:serine kinase of HPr protein (carbohydrate metabolism regulator)